MLEPDKGSRSIARFATMHVSGYVHNTTNLWQNLQEAHIDEYLSLIGNLVQLRRQQQDSQPLEKHCLQVSH